MINPKTTEKRGTGSKILTSKVIPLTTILLGNEVNVDACIDLNFDPIVVIFWNGVNGTLNCFEIPFAGWINNYGPCNFRPTCSSYTIYSLRDTHKNGHKQSDNENKWRTLHFQVKWRSERAIKSWNIVHLTTIFMVIYNHVNSQEYIPVMLLF